MAGNTERLVMLIEAQNTDVLRKLDQVERKTRQTFGRGAKDTKGFTNELGRATNAAKGFAMAFAGGILAGGFAGLISSAKAAAESIASIGDAAQRAGIGIQAFQELAYVAEQNRIPVDALVDGMKELNLRADEFITTGKGPAAEAFQRLGFSATQLREALKNPSELLVEIIDRMQRLNTAAQIRVADEVFGGTAGERFVELLDMGADGIREMIREGHELGIIIDEEMVQKAKDVDRAFKQLAQTVGTNVKSAIVSAASEVQHLLNLLDSVDQRQESTIRREIAERQAAIQGAQNSVFGGLSGTYVENQQAEILKLQKELLRRQLDRPRQTVPTYSRDNGIVWNPSQAMDDGGSSGGGGGGGASSSRRVRDFTESVKDATSAQKELNSATNGFGSIASSAFSAITSQINTGNAALDRFLSTLIEATGQALLFGQGPLANLFGGGGGGGIGGLLGGLFGGFFANGGNLGAGKWGIAGENGPEIIKGPAQVVPMNRMGGGGGQTQTVVQVVPSPMFDVIVEEKAGQSAAAAAQFVANDVRTNFSSYARQNAVNRGTG